jgi:hypothetical protein
LHLGLMPLFVSPAVPEGTGPPYGGQWRRRGKWCQHETEQRRTAVRRLVPALEHPPSGHQRPRLASPGGGRSLAPVDSSVGCNDEPVSRELERTTPEPVAFWDDSVSATFTPSPIASGLARVER